MSRPVLEVEFCGPGSLVRGYGSRALVEAVAGKPPVWISRLRGWSCQEKTARNVVALAETQGYDVLITAQRTRKAHLFAVLSAAPPPRAPVNRDGGLW
ncbi:hypothetical protein [Nocardioides lianchengensis]|uniref:Uncharacterized protein n=1 Tax=Nocardioides lianchengensis TaxID=1045774 RepID=A0A1G6YJS6_9ACTN|nr:hypothetical protein [Nocardioides lianchengensis]NYG09643.1 hypothetical protein [Nocardioides lianchengensis]SDD89796.1 hypothetical protein SAMN05421872_11250 [Nocardioides lianchengensis]